MTTQLPSDKQGSTSQVARRRGEHAAERVVLVLDDSLLRDVIEAALARDGAFEVVGSADETSAATALALELQPAIVVVDGDAVAIVDLIERIQALATTRARVVCLVSMGDPATIAALLHAGVTSCIAKSVAGADLAAVIRHASRGSIFHEARLPVAADLPPDSQPALTTRELEILTLAARGFRNKQIAVDLWVTEQTVKFHLTNTFRKLMVCNRTAAARRAETLGLIESRPSARLPR